MTLGDILGALVGVALSTMALAGSMILLYLVIIGIQSAVEERRMKMGNGLVKRVKEFHETRSISLACDIVDDLYDEYINM